MTSDEVAEKAGIDPKTLDRWISGRVPHPRNRHALAEVLGVHSSDLWPEADPFARLVPRDLAGVQCVYASRSAFLSVFPPERLFAEATAISISGLSNNLLCQQFADRRLEQLLRLGTTVTCLFLDPKGRGTADREVEERHAPGYLAGLTSINITTLQRIRAGLPEGPSGRLVLATYDQTIRFNIVIVTYGDNKTAVVQPYLPHFRGVESPTLVLHPTPEPGLFDTFQLIFDELRAESVEC